MGNLSRKIVFQDYTLLLGQQQRLRERAQPWNAAIQVDKLPVLYRRYYQSTFGDTSSSGPWWRGWDGSLDIENLEKLGSFDRDFDCNGCSLPKRPHHPQKDMPRWMLLLSAATAGAAAAVIFTRRR